MLTAIQDMHRMCMAAPAVVWEPLIIIMEFGAKPKTVYMILKYMVFRPVVKLSMLDFSRVLWQAPVIGVAAA